MAADTCLDAGAGGLEVEAPPAAAPQTRAPRALELSPRSGPRVGRGRNRAAWPGGPGGGSGREAGGSLSPRGRGAAPGSRAPGLLCGAAVGPGPAARPVPRARGRASRPGRERGRAGRGLGSAPPPAPPGPRADRARSAPRSAENWVGIKEVGAGSAEEQGEASGVLDASRVRLIIKLIKASI